MGDEFISQNTRLDRLLCIADQRFCLIMHKVFFEKSPHLLRSRVRPTGQPAG